MRQVDMTLSQRTLVRMMDLLGKVNDSLEDIASRDYKRRNYYYVSGSATDQYWSRRLYEHEFGDRFVELARKKYWNWDTVLKQLRSGEFCKEAAFPPQK